MLKPPRPDSQALSSLANLAIRTDVILFTGGRGQRETEDRPLACSPAAAEGFLAICILQFLPHHFHLQKVEGGFRLLNTLLLTANKGKFIQHLAFSQLSPIFILFSPFYTYLVLTGSWPSIFLLYFLRQNLPFQTSPVLFPGESLLIPSIFSEVPV